ncbi:LacI family DNA-binding transcriptional regulator [Microlunatus ginsengisoli]|uniref:HTH lacI-type domain-containing protein n=1 Tax=Microlunatus ginsengisoli TaxID=363863 RepID=A0ABP7AJA0_9ACTN
MVDDEWAAGRRVTLSDVATYAAVSRALVSIVMRDAPGASAATRARVRAAAENRGYNLVLSPVSRGRDEARRAGLPDPPPQLARPLRPQVLLHTPACRSTPVVRGVKRQSGV